MRYRCVVRKFKSRLTVAQSADKERIITSVESTAGHAFVQGASMCVWQAVQYAFDVSLRIRQAWLVLVHDNSES